MHRYILTIIFMIVGLTLGLLSYLKDSNKSLCRILAVLSFIVSVGSGIIETNLPTPEFYMTNGDNSSDNKGYFKVEFPLSVYYTLIPYTDPKKDGTKYENPFDADSSFSISYVSSVMGIMWSETKSEDIVLKSNGSVEAINTSEPGSSIAKIVAYLNRDHVFPGDILEKDDFIVKGETIAGDKVTMDEFEFSPSQVVEGENEITIDYKGIINTINFWVDNPKVISIKAEYLGEDISIGSAISKEDIAVTATYEDGHVEEIKDFEIVPSECNEEGENTIQIQYEDCSDEILVNAVTGEEENSLKGTLFSNCYEKHDDSSIIPQIGFGYWDGAKRDVQGNSYDDGQLYISIWDLYNRMQDTGDSFIDSSIIYIVNPNCDLSKGVHVKGKFVVDDEYIGSDAYTDISIKIDGKEVWTTAESISGSTISPTIFEFDVNQGDESMTMDFHCNARSKGLGLGIIFEEIG